MKESGGEKSGNGAFFCKLPLMFELDQEEQEVVQHFTSQVNTLWCEYQDFAISTCRNYREYINLGNRSYGLIVATFQARRGKDVSFEDLSSRLDACKQPFLMLIKLCSQPVSAAGSENKARELVSGLVFGFKRYLAERSALQGPDTKVQDFAFQLFMFKQCSLPVIQSVFISFSLVGCRR